MVRGILVWERDDFRESGVSALRPRFTFIFFFFFQAEDGIRDLTVTGVQTCALPIFEHHWAVPAALEFHSAIGSARITQRIHALNQAMNEELRKLPNVKIVYTPADPQLNAGLVCFDLNGLDADKTVAKLLEKNIVASTTPYAVP